jgi:hypothetical protein
MTTEFPGYLATATGIAGMLLTALITGTHETTRNAHAYPLIYDAYLGALLCLAITAAAYYKKPDLPGLPALCRQWLKQLFLTWTMFEIQTLFYPMHSLVSLWWILAWAACTFVGRGLEAYRHDLLQEWEETLGLYWVLGLIPYTMWTYAMVAAVFVGHEVM